jgi:uncharacterized repeat protein (TIGR03803 family)
MKLHPMTVAIATIATLAMVALPVWAPSAQAQTFTSIYSFGGPGDGENPEFGVIMDDSGTLYGATTRGGSGYGTVYKLTNGTETILYTFSGSADGSYPFGGVIMDQSGTLYGTTSAGGSSGAGTLFALDSTGTFTTLYSFKGGTDGSEPASALLLRRGDLYGTTVLGGSGYGTVYKLNIESKVETVLHRFTGADGSGPKYGNLLMDKAGNLYGTTTYGGGSGCFGGGCGTVWKLSATGEETVLHSFTGGSDGSSLFEQSLAMDTENNLYGTAEEGGAHNAGIVFKVNITSKIETVLYSFTGGSDGSLPASGIFRARNGRLFGTTELGGDSGFGTVFVLKGTQETVLHSFDNNDGAYPFTSLLGMSGAAPGVAKLWGVTNGGGQHNVGTVFSLEV